ncbi:hypothetical protein HOLleu_43004 [Holothuria leucospilota]|uniref:Uncharacterized protein n=1 Tax=Holothuria leucospilota TaxID=206669 RepID=A0A9Q0YC70_HOLLE|nr:hypothetical protein HOLleu_43004 [Holothuria leucospilota]
MHWVHFSLSACIDSGMAVDHCHRWHVPLFSFRVVLHLLVMHTSLHIRIISVIITVLEWHIFGDLNTFLQEVSSLKGDLLCAVYAIIRRGKYSFFYLCAVASYTLDI